MKPVFSTAEPLVSSDRIRDALKTALDTGESTRMFESGGVDTAFASGGIVRAHYAVGAAANAPLETLTATARVTGDRLEVWAPVQAPGLARSAAARAAGFSESRVTVYAMPAGGGYGRKLETNAVRQAVTMALELKRPVQLVWSRMEETMQDSFRPPALASVEARIASGAVITGWRTRIAAPATMKQLIARIGSGEAADGDEADASAVAGAAPPYGIPAVAVEHVPVELGLRTGVWRSGAHSYTAFFTESFIDEVARKASLDPFSFRMQMLGGNPRLARCLATATTLGGWDGGGSGSSMGIAAHAAFGSFVATLVEVSVGADRRVRVLRAISAVDCGRVVNPEIVRQLIEGGIVHGIAGATGERIEFEAGLPSARNLGDLGLPRLADSPEVTVEILESDEPPGGVTELGVPTVAPAIANALFALTGERLRMLPLRIGTGS
jgi:isoquinoline 1-oxidoreductase beta subunit